MGTQRHRTREIRQAQGLRGGSRQREVSEAVVYAADALLAQPQRPVDKPQVARVADRRPIAPRFERSFEQQELGIQILLLWRVIQDGHQRVIGASALRLPFIEQDVDGGLLGLAGSGRRAQRRQAKTLCLG